MPTFNFKAMDSSGKEVSGTLSAQNQAAAVAMLRKEGYVPTNVTAADGSNKQSGLNMSIKLPKLIKPRVKAKNLMVLTRQLATLVDSGLPLLRGLRILAKQEKNDTLRKALIGMSESVEGGSTFSDALALYPKIFNNLYINMAKAGEAGGVLETVLNRLAEFLEKAEKIKNKVKGAMTYPIVVLCVALGITGFLMVKVIPQFEKVFSDLMDGKAMPPLTQAVINFSHNFADMAPVWAIGIVAIVVLLNLWNRTASGHYALDAIKLRIPVMGQLILKSSISRTTRTLGTLMSSGVPVLQALNIVRDTSGNAVLAKVYQSIHDSVKEGENMTPAMERSKVFPAMVVSMVDVGEETGALPDMLARVANTYDDEVDTAVEAMTSIIEPILIVFLALVVGTIVIAMFQPLVSIIGGMG
ncbi:MAG: type II secretion system F family protein [Kiritimatiellae bacterium]|nr:type II secretion system F family protein [Kiritimatiellia bacterium]